MVNAYNNGITDPDELEKILKKAEKDTTRDIIDNEIPSKNETVQMYWNMFILSPDTGSIIEHDDKCTEEEIL